MLLGKKLTAKVADFGMARDVSRDGEYIKTTEVCTYSKIGTVVISQRPFLFLCAVTLVTIFDPRSTLGTSLLPVEHKILCKFTIIRELHVNLQA